MSLRNCWSHFTLSGRGPLGPSVPISTSMLGLGLAAARVTADCTRSTSWMSAAGGCVLPGIGANCPLWFRLRFASKLGSFMV